MMSHGLRRLAYIVACAMLALPAFAGVTGSISGRIVDPNGALVPNAVVTVTSTETSTQLTAKTGADGEYHFLALPVGHYALKATAPWLRLSKSRTSPLTRMTNCVLTLPLAWAARHRRSRFRRTPCMLRLRAPR